MDAAATQAKWTRAETVAGRTKKQQSKRKHFTGESGQAGDWKGLVNKRNLIKGPKFSKQATGSSHVFICSIFLVNGWGVKLGLG